MKDQDNKEYQEEWGLESIKEKAYLPRRSKFFADNIYIIGSGVATILALIILFSK